MSKVIHIGIGDLNVTRTPGESLKTMALGSCVAVVMMDPATRAIGMVHVALPDSSIDRLRGLSQPGYFADTGIPSLMMKLAELGCDKRGYGFIVKIMGGANIMDSSGVFNIGKRNVLTCRKILWQMKLPIHAEDVGGEFSRTVEVEQDTGKIILSCPGKANWEL